MQKTAKFFLFLGVMLLTGACSSAMRISSSPVQTNAPMATAAYTKVARIELRWTGIRTEGEVRRDERIRRALQAEAERLGADAIIDITMISQSAGQRPGSLLLEEPPRFKGVSATAIRFS